METAFITNSKGEKKSAVISLKEYERLLDIAEEFEEIKAYDKAMRRIKKRDGSFVSLKEVIRLNTLL